MRYALLVLLTACQIPTAQDSNVRPYDPPEIYAAWWQTVETCSNHTGDLSRISWFAVRPVNDSTASFWGGSAAAPHLVSAEWLAPHRILVLDTTASLTAVGYPDGEIHIQGIVAHEMLHDLLGGDPTHSDSAWAKCFMLYGHD